MFLYRDNRIQKEEQLGTLKLISTVIQSRRLDRSGRAKYEYSCAEGCFRACS